MENDKPFWQSKTLWLNALAFVGMIVQNVTGNQVVTPELGGALIVIANFVLRLVTKGAVRIA